MLLKKANLIFNQLLCMHPASTWLYTHWIEEYLPNNKWVAASAEGKIAEDENLDIVINEVANRSISSIVFAFITLIFQLVWLILVLTFFQVPASAATKVGLLPSPTATSISISTAGGIVTMTKLTV